MILSLIDIWRLTLQHHPSYKTRYRALALFPVHDEEAVESTLLKQVTKEKKAKRRTRGPYRKSYQV